MHTHPGKRIDIIIEMPLVKRVTGQLDQAGVTGYTVLPVLAGRGQAGPWSADSLIGAAGQMASIVCIVDPARADQVLDTVFAVVERQIGIVTVTDVAVVRPDRF